MNALDSIAEIMLRRGSRCTLEEFHAAVNLVFHDFEAEIYDSAHRDMWESLPRQLALLVSDCVAFSSRRDELRLLDIGCGTGLASDCILKSSLGPKIASIDLLDTSAVMLKRALHRAESWGGRVTSPHQGTVETLSAESQYDVIVTCSVLHHIPDVASFLHQVRQLQAPGGLFIHLQDPNGDYMKDPGLQRRIARRSRKLLPHWALRLTPRRILGRLHREITGKQGKDYLSETNLELMKRGIVQSPLSVAEIFTITDIHVQDGAGISIQQIKASMPDYDLISQRAYGFFGELPSELTPKLKAMEEQLSATRALNGAYVGAAWRLRKSSDPVTR